MVDSIYVKDRFFDKAATLRSYFDECFTDPKAVTGDRFVWDYWNVPNQYTLLRTPAYTFFPKPVYEAFHRKLVSFGQEMLGCHDVSPTWLSCYVDGCEQKLHGDLPHGPWAFVFSLTPWKKRQFTGGETILMKEEILSYWDNFESGKGLEEAEIFHKIEPLFNRLVVFDPRIPHGVETVKGVRDVCAGRLVIHGWFVNPRPFVKGPLRDSDLKSAMDGLSEALQNNLSSEVNLNGVLTLRFEVLTSGRVQKIKFLSNTLRGTSQTTASEIQCVIRRYFQQRSFSKQRGLSQVTIPVFFETSRGN